MSEEKEGRGKRKWCWKEQLKRGANVVSRSRNRRKSGLNALSS